MFSSYFSSRSRGSWFPPVDILESKGKYKLLMDLPEVEKKDIKVYAEGRTVICISGMRVRQISEEDSKGLFIAERGSGHFERCFELSEAFDEGGLKASFKNQVLIVEIPQVSSAGKKENSSVKID